MNDDGTQYQMIHIGAYQVGQGCNSVEHQQHEASASRRRRSSARKHGFSLLLGLSFVPVFLKAPSITTKSMEIRHGKRKILDPFANLVSLFAFSIFSTHFTPFSTFRKNTFSLGNNFIPTQTHTPTRIAEHAALNSILHYWFTNFP